MKKKIIIADDHFVVRIGTALIIESKYKNVEIDHAEDYEELIMKLKLECFDLVILDINMPNSKHQKMMSEIKFIQPEIKILIFSAYDDNIGAQYIMQDADGYLNKLNNENKIIEALESIFSNGSYYSSGIIKKIKEFTINRKPLNPLILLSNRETEIYNLLISGLGNVEIAKRLGIQITTVSTYKNRIFEKLNVKNIAELVKHNLQIFPENGMR